MEKQFEVNDRKMSRQNIRLLPSILASSYDDSLIDIQAFVLSVDRTFPAHAVG